MLRSVLNIKEIPKRFSGRNSIEQNKLAFDIFCETLILMSGMDMNTWVPFENLHLEVSQPAKAHKAQQSIIQKTAH